MPWALVALIILCAVIANMPQSHRGRAVTVSVGTVDDVKVQATNVTAAVREVSERLASVTSLQEHIRQVMAEQSEMTARTRDLVIAAAREVAASATTARQSPRPRPPHATRNGLPWSALQAVTSRRDADSSRREGAATHGRMAPLTGHRAKIDHYAELIAQGRDCDAVELTDPALRAAQRSLQ